MSLLCPTTRSTREVLRGVLSHHLDVGFFDTTEEMTESQLSPCCFEEFPHLKETSYLRATLSRQGREEGHRVSLGATGQEVST